MTAAFGRSEQRVAAVGRRTLLDPCLNIFVIVSILNSVSAHTAYKLSQGSGCYLLSRKRSHSTYSAMVGFTTICIRGLMHVGTG